MFQTAPGVTIPFPDKILEEYQIFEDSICAHVSYEKLSALVADFYRALPEPLFFVMQLPLSIDEENKMGFKKIFKSSYGQLLLSDGLSQFAIASHQSHEEINVADILKKQGMYRAKIIEN